MDTQASTKWFGESLLFELDISERQLTALADAMPAEKFDWRPDSTARSVGEVFVHVAAGNFFLLEAAGRKGPVEFYGEISEQGDERLWSVIRRNDQLEKTIAGKERVVDFLKRSFTAVRDSLNEIDDALLQQPAIRRVYMRLVAHTHEHMGQMIAYTRANGMRVPWPDWHPDRRTN